MLRVHGESMINAGILNGDHVIVRKQSSANNGEIVVAMTEDNEATVKKIFQRRWLLSSAARKRYNGSNYFTCGSNFR